MNIGTIKSVGRWVNLVSVAAEVDGLSERKGSGGVINAGG